MSDRIDAMEIQIAANTAAIAANIAVTRLLVAAPPPAPPVTTATCGAGKQWVTWTTGLEPYPAGIAYPGERARDLIRTSTDHLHRVCTADLTECLYVQDSAPDFMRGDYETAQVSYSGTKLQRNERGIWRSRDANIKCAASSGSTLVNAATFDVSCNPTSAVGHHTCGSNNGWSLYTSGYTYNFSGRHPCPVAAAVHTLVTFQVCVPDAAAATYAGLPN
jgi:hypothetical protein